MRGAHDVLCDARMKQDGLALAATFVIFTFAPTAFADDSGDAETQDAARDAAPEAGDAKSDAPQDTGPLIVSDERPDIECSISAPGASRGSISIALAALLLARRRRG